jgi:hypothetical protein
MTGSFADGFGSARVALRVPATWLAFDPRVATEVRRVAALCGEGVEKLKSLNLVPESSTSGSFSFEVSHVLTLLGEEGVIYCMLRHPRRDESVADGASSVHMELAVRRQVNLAQIPPPLLEDMLVAQAASEDNAGPVLSSQLSSGSGLPIYRLSWSQESRADGPEAIRRTVQYVQCAEELDAVIVSTFSVFSTGTDPELDEEFDEIACSVSLVA